MPLHKLAKSIASAWFIGLILIGCLPALPVSHNSPLAEIRPIPSKATFVPPTATSTQTNPPIAVESTATRPVPTAAVTPTLRAEWITVEPDQTLTVPILLYHHIADHSGNDGRYYVSPAAFRSQLQALKNLGYYSVTVTELAAVLENGGSLPPRPVVITFDDGNTDLYETAFPLMQEFGFIGTMYLITGDIKKGTGISVEQAREMSAAGWEIAGHSMTHPDLVKSNADLRSEICYSRLDLEDLLGTSVYSFSYPYGTANDYVKQYTRDCGYTSAVGVGTSITHTSKSIYFLSRREVQGDFDLKAFSGLLPHVEMP